MPGRVAVGDLTCTAANASALRLSRRLGGRPVRVPGSANARVSALAAAASSRACTSRSSVRSRAPYCISSRRSTAARSLTTATTPNATSATLGSSIPHSSQTNALRKSISSVVPGIPLWSYHRPPAHPHPVSSPHPSPGRRPPMNTPRGVLASAAWCTVARAWRSDAARPPGRPLVRRHPSKWQWNAATSAPHASQDDRKDAATEEDWSTRQRLLERTRPDPIALAVAAAVFVVIALAAWLALFRVH